MKKVGIGLLILCFAALCGGGIWRYWQTRNETSAETITSEDPVNIVEDHLMEDHVDELANDNHFSGSLLVVRQGKIVLSKGYGYTNEQLKKKNTPETVYPIASIQKSLTGILIAQLAQEGKLSYKDKVAEYYPKKFSNKTITIRDLLNHTSGVQMEEKAPDRAVTTEKEQLENALIESDVSDDTSYNYTNGNYTLLAGIASQVTKQSYEELLKHRIFKPLGITDARVWDGQTEETPLAYTYENGSKAIETPDKDQLFASLLGAGNLMMTPLDLWKIQMGLIDWQLLDQKAYNQLTENEKDGYRGGMGYGDHIRSVSGSIAGYTSRVIETTDNQTAVIVLANQQPEPDTSTFAQKIFDYAKEES